MVEIPASSHQPGRTHYHEQRRGGEDLGALRARHETKHVTQQQATTDDHGEDRADHADDAHEVRRVRIARQRAPEQGHGGDQGDRGQILEEQDGKGLSTINGAGFLALGEDLQTEGGRGQREAATDDDGCFPGQAEQEVPHDAEGETAGEDLQAAAAEHGAAHHPQSRR